MFRVPWTYWDRDQTRATGAGRRTYKPPRRLHRDPARPVGQLCGARLQAACPLCYPAAPAGARYLVLVPEPNDTAEFRSALKTWIPYTVVPRRDPLGHLPARCEHVVLAQEVPAGVSGAESATAVPQRAAGANSTQATGREAGQARNEPASQPLRDFPGDEPLAFTGSVPARSGPVKAF